MAIAPNPYDELPYHSFPIEWTAPERLAVASLLHGGPRSPRSNYRVLELGCGTGANLVALAYFRRHSTFVGVDGSAREIAVAARHAAELRLDNLRFLHADFRSADEHLEGPFDFILAHGVISWVPDDVRDAIFDLVTHRLVPGGLFYSNYNCRPGWDVRGLVREFLLGQTAGTGELSTRARQAQEVAGRVANALTGIEHNYSRLIADEFRFVAEGDLTWVGHEFLADVNRPYWRSEFLSLARSHGLEYVADADFNYATGRVQPDLAERIAAEGLTGRNIDDTVDFLCYRQLHAPILTHAPFHRVAATIGEIGELRVASILEPVPTEPGLNPVFRHPTGFEVEAKDAPMFDGLTRLHAAGPAGLRVADAFADVATVEEDLRLLHRSGLLDLRAGGPDDRDPAQLNRLERERGYFTTPYHQTGRLAAD